MVMVGQNRRLREPLRWTKAGKASVAAAAVLVIAAAIALVVAVSVGSKGLAKGCIAVTFPSTLGGATVQECGASAKRDCASPRSSDLSGSLEALKAACEDARLPYEVAGS
jgi:hypothetical protein